LFYYCPPIAQKTSGAFSEVFQKAATLKMNRFAIFLKNEGSICFCAVL
jgi:hypothetical protein